jgi:hypothetical protein
VTTHSRLYDGQPNPPPEQRTLYAGPLSVQFQNGMIRNIRLGDQLVMQSIYAAVRDQNWGTVPGDLRDLTIDTDADRFDVRFRMAHQQGDVDFTWDGTITGTPAGTVAFHFAGQANTTFKRNRVGFCVQHPMHLAGRPCTVEHIGGTTTAGAFPDTIAPHQPYFDIRAITHTVMPGVQARVLMEGDTFEMEDQRNWTDASYKTYCTPLDLPFPATVEAGTGIVQTITLSLTGDVPARAEPAGGAVLVALTDKTVPLPPIGLGLNVHQPDAHQPDATQIDRLRTLNLAHLRLDLPLYEAKWRERLYQAAAQAADIRAALEMAVFVSDDAERELTELAAMDVRQVARWLIFHRDEKSTSAQWVRLAKRILPTDAPIGAGTNAFFTELNRERPPTDVTDCVCYSLNPQVHAFDNASLVETLPAQAETVRSARAFSDDQPVIVGPVTLKMRWNPNATGSDAGTPAGQLPPEVDVRQMSLFGAGWTLGSIKYLAESGAASITYYETLGWRGVMDHANPLPELFPAEPGGVFPLYHVLADVGAFAGGEVIIAESSQPLTVSVLALRKDGRVRLLLANHTLQTQMVNLDGAWTGRTLDTSTAALALTDPATFRSQSSTLPGALTLAPYTVVCLDEVAQS